MNAHGVGEVALAGATSNLFAMLADSYRRSKRIQAGDEIIIHDSSHEVCCTSCKALYIIQSAVHLLQLRQRQPNCHVKCEMGLHLALTEGGGHKTRQ